MGDSEMSIPAAAETAQTRLLILDTLTHGTQSVRDVVDQTDRSRSTVSQAVSDLEDAVFAERADGGYRATLTGRLAAEQVQNYFDAITDIAETEAALSRLPPDAPVAPAMVVGAEVRVADDPAPYRVNEPVRDSLNEATGFRSLNASIPEPDFIQQVYERTLAGELDGEAIVSPEVHEALQSDFSALVAELVDSGHFRILIAEDLFYGLLLVDGSTTTPPAFLLAPDDQGRTGGLLVNDSPAALHWAEQRYESVRERAKDVTDAYAD